MRVEIWFDFNKDSLEVINNFNNAFERFKFASDIDVLFRSLPKVETNFKYHELFQYGRKKGFKHAYLCDVFKVYNARGEMMNALDGLSKIYPLNMEDLKHSLDKHQSLKIVKNQIEHATLQKIDVAPTLTFTHGFRLVGLSSIADIEATLIKMYEKDSGIKYCIEEDCER